MIGLDLAKELKAWGLEWKPGLHDFFAVPDSDLDNRIFVVSDIMVDVQQLFGQEIIAFNGAVEWSMDNIMINDVVWMPTESQLRELIQIRLSNEPDGSLQLFSQRGKCRCQIIAGGSSKNFESEDAADAYGSALLFLLKQ